MLPVGLDVQPRLYDVLGHKEQAGPQIRCTHSSSQAPQGLCNHSFNKTHDNENWHPHFWQLAVPVLTTHWHTHGWHLPPIPPLAPVRRPAWPQKLAWVSACTDTGFNMSSRTVPTTPSYLEAHLISPLSNHSISQRREATAAVTRICPLLPKVQKEASSKPPTQFLAIGGASVSQTRDDHQAAKAILNNSPKRKQPGNQLSKFALTSEALPEHRICSAATKKVPANQDCLSNPTTVIKVLTSAHLGPPLRVFLGRYMTALLLSERRGCSRKPWKSPVGLCNSFCLKVVHFSLVNDKWFRWLWLLWANP